LIKPGGIYLPKDVCPCAESLDGIAQDFVQCF
jgi:hypothetical protein